MNNMEKDGSLSRPIMIRIRRSPGSSMCGQAAFLRNEAAQKALDGYSEDELARLLADKIDELDV
jgi:hypothetical protein